jgi:hypothetical protein
MTLYDELMRGLLDGSISPIEAQDRALEEFVRSQAEVAERWTWDSDNLNAAGERIVQKALDVIEAGEYAPCRRAGFFAALYTPGGLVTNIKGNAPADGLPLDCHLGGCETCMRDETGATGDRYDNCTSVHAAQWLRVPEGRKPWDLLWVEGGAVLNRDGTYSLSRKRNSPDVPYPSRMYRCSMCLKTMLGQGIEDLACVSLDEDGNVEFQFAPIKVSLSTLMICNVAEMVAGNTVEAGGS